MTKYIAGLGSGVLCALAAGWLILAPFALGYQPAGQAWSDATGTELWTGIGLLVLALAAAVLYARGLVGELRLRGLLAPRPSGRVRPAASRAAGVEAGAPSQADQTQPQMDEVLLPLVTAVLADLQQRQASRRTAPTPASRHRRARRRRSER